MFDESLKLTVTVRPNVQPNKFRVYWDGFHTVQYVRPTARSQQPRQTFSIVCAESCYSPPPSNHIVCPPSSFSIPKSHANRHTFTALDAFWTSRSYVPSITLFSNRSGCPSLSWQSRNTLRRENARIKEQLYLNVKSLNSHVSALFAS